jgi:HEAT repeat protein
MESRFVLSGLWIVSVLAASGWAQPAQPTAPPSEGMETIVAAAIPGLTDEDLAQRETAQRAFEQLCLTAGNPLVGDERRELCLAIAAHLGSDTPHAARVWLLRQVAMIGHDEVVPAVARLLSDENAQIRELARRALEHNPDDSATMPLIAALQQTQEPTWQVALLNALAARRARAAVPALVSLSGDPQRPVAVRAAAVRGLGMIADFRSLRALRALWPPKAPELQPVVFEALLTCAERLNTDGHQRTAAKLSGELLRTAPEEAQRVAALSALVRAADIDALPELMQRVTGASESPEMHAAAKFLLAELRDTEVDRLVRDRVTAPPADAQVRLLWVIAQRATPSAAPVVTPLLVHPDAAVRVAAAEALAVVGNWTSVMPLGEAAADVRNPALQAAARATLARLTGERIDAVLRGAAQSAPPLVRAEFIRTLAARQMIDTVPVLRRQADPQQPIEVRLAALDALAKLADADVAAEMIALLFGATDATVRAAAEDAVVAACLKASTPGARIAPLLAAWIDADATGHVALVQMLGRVGGPAALGMLRTTLRSDEPEVVDATIRVLSNWPTAAPRDDLLTIARQTEDRKRHILALRGYFRLLRDAAEGASMAARVDAYAAGLDAARDPSLRRLALSGLQGVPHPRAIALIRALAQDADLRADAEAALVALGMRLAPVDFAAAHDAIKEVAQTSADEAVRAMATAALEQIERLRGHVSQWIYSGPYTLPEGTWEMLFDTPLGPELAGKEPAWQPLPIMSGDQPWIFDLTQLDNRPQRCVFVVARIEVTGTHDARLNIGSDDAVKVWLNDELVHSNRVVRGHTPFEDAVDVTLRPGVNTVMMKIVQAGGGWQFSCKITDAEGDPPTWLHVLPVATE